MIAATMKGERTMGLAWYDYTVAEYTAASVSSMKESMSRQEKRINELENEIKKLSGETASAKIDNPSRMAQEKGGWRKMKPCPFCGNANESTLTILEPHTPGSFFGDDIYYRCRCKECNAFGPPSKSKSNAIMHWNMAGEK